MSFKFPYTLHFSLEDRHGSADLLHAEFTQSIGRREIYNLIETVRSGILVPFGLFRTISDPLFKTFYDLCKNCAILKITLDPTIIGKDDNKDNKDNKDKNNKDNKDNNELDDLFRDWFREEVSMKIVVRRDGENVFDISIKNEECEDDVEDENEMNIRYLTRFLFF